MKTIRSKKLNKRIETICDFSPITSIPAYADTTNTQTGGTDTTNTTITIITTSHRYLKV